MYVWNTFLAGRGQLTARWTCACRDGEASHTQRRGAVGAEPDLQLSPQPATAFHQTLQHNTHSPLLSYLLAFSVWYKQPRRDTVGYMSYLALYYYTLSPYSVKYNAFNSPTHWLLFFFSFSKRQRPVCLLVLAKGQKALSDIIPAIDQTLFTLTWFLSPPAIRRQPSTSCSADRLYTFIFPLSGNFSCCGWARRSVGVY